MKIVSLTKVSGNILNPKAMTNDKRKVLFDLEKKISLGLEMTMQRLITKKKRDNEELVISKDGKILIIKPEDFEKYGIGNS